MNVCPSQPSRPSVAQANATIDKMAKNLEDVRIGTIKLFEKKENKIIGNIHAEVTQTRETASRLRNNFALSMVALRSSDLKDPFFSSVALVNPVFDSNSFL